MLIDGLTPESAVLFSAVAAALPALLFAGLIYWADRYEKEPWWLLSATFLWGALPSVGLALLVSSLLSVPLYLLFDGRTAGTITAGAIAPVVEETVKGLILLVVFFRWRQEIDTLLDGIIYGAMVGMGFAMVENIFYFLDVYESGGTEAWTAIVFLRAFVFGLNHAFYTSWTGLGIAAARLSKSTLVSVLAPVLGWSTAVFVHATHNIVVSLDTPAGFFLALAFDWSGILLVVVIIFLALWQERRWLRDYLEEEVGLGTLTSQEYQVIGSSMLRTRYRLRTLQDAGLGAMISLGQLLERYSELAYRKHHFQLFQDDATSLAIDSVRKEIKLLHEKVRVAPPV